MFWIMDFQIGIIAILCSLVFVFLCASTTSKCQLVFTIPILKQIKGNMCLYRHNVQIPSHSYLICAACGCV